MSLAEPLFDDLAPVPEGPILTVRNLTVSFPSETGRVEAVRGLDYDLAAGEVLGIVGESGSGKSVTSMAMMGLLPKTATITGDVYFRGRSIRGLPDKDFRRLRGERSRWCSRTRSRR